MKTKVLSLGNWIKANSAFCVVAVLLSIIYLALSLWRHWHFQSGGFDLGIFDQAIWHYSRFEAPMGTIRVTRHLLADHFHPILLALAPLYWIVPKPETLLVVQNLLWTAGLVPIYLFARHRGHSLLVSILLILSYGFFWGVTLALNFDFHEVAFAFFLIPLSIYLAELKKWKWLWICFAILLLVKEEMAFVVAFFGLYLVARGYWKQGLATFIAGVSWFLLVTRLFIPYFAGPGGGFGYWTYSQVGDSPTEAVKTLLTQPLRVISLLFNPEVKAHTLKAIFWPFFFLPLLSPIMIIGIPLILQRFLSDQSLYWQDNFHYTGTISAILIMALTDVLSRIKKLPNPLAANLVVAISVAVLMFNLYNVPNRSLNSFADPNFWHLSQNEKVGYQLLKTIPQEASVSTQDRLLPHLSQRDYAYMLDNNQSFYFSEYIIIYDGPIVNPFPTFADMRKYVEGKIDGKEYAVVTDTNGWVIWHNPKLSGGAPVEERV